eukprot:COSAG02_NODE_606_length_19624_cov_33.479846_24_plen_126_part_00
MSAINGFEQEIEFHEGLVHPHIVHIVQCLGHTRGVFPPLTREQNALVMEYIPLTLYQRLHCDDWQSTMEAMRSLRQRSLFGYKSMGSGALRIEQLLTRTTAIWSHLRILHLGHNTTWTRLFDVWD